MQPPLTIARLSNLIKKLQKVPINLDEYDKIIQNQLKKGIVERVSNETLGKENVLLHKAVIPEAAQSTTMRIVFDTVTKANQGGP